MAAKTFLPVEGDLQAVTIRLEDVDDRIWRRMKAIMAEVERSELKALAESEPASIRAPEAGRNAKDPVLLDPSSTSASESMKHNVLPSPQTLTLEQVSQLRSIYFKRKCENFQRLLLRVPLRAFLSFRLPSVLPALAEASTDRWTLRPYPISTKPLYETDHTDGAHAPSVSIHPDMSRKRRRKEEEPEVTFEMPVSLDALDEKVAEGARRSVSKRGRGRGRGVLDAGKRKPRKSALGRICQGCGREDVKVWRRGPGGKGTRKFE